MLATRQPVLRRFWYPVMPVASLEKGPQPFTLLGTNIVVWSPGDGTYAALEDRCAHRSAALSKGWILQRECCSTTVIRYGWRNPAMTVPVLLSARQAPGWCLYQ